MFRLIVALAAMMGVLGIGIHGGMAVFAETPEQKSPYKEIIAEGKDLYLEAGCYAPSGGFSNLCRPSTWYGSESRQSSHNPLLLGPS